MKKVKDCEVENCIPTPSSCVEWNGGDIKFLGICDGDSLNNLAWEIVTKLEAITGDDLSEFDVDSLVEICNKTAPAEITILSILNLLKDNQVCLKDFINGLSDQIAALSGLSSVNVDLKCYSDFDNQGNALSINRDQLDQLVINNLCNHRARIETLEGKVIDLQSQIDNIDVSPVVDEQSFATCINGAVLPTSTQVINTSAALCDLRASTGTPANIAAALANTPGDLNAEFNTITGWNNTPANWAANYSNLLLEVQNLRVRIKSMETNCCASSCDDIILGFSAVYNEDNTGVIIKFTSGAGTSIPAEMVDQGSTGTITDKNGAVESFSLDIVDNFTNNNETDVAISGLDLSGDLTISITAKIGNDGLTCEKCIGKVIKQAACNFCEICATGDDGATAVILYESSSSSVVIENSTTTTTTVP